MIGQPAPPVPVIRVIPHELLRVLEGRTLRVDDADGNTYELRLFTAEEFLTAQHAAVDCNAGGTKIDLGRARDLTAPLRLR